MFREPFQTGRFSLSSPILLWHIVNDRVIENLIQNILAVEASTG
jgi:hypothetical protein